VRVKVIEREPRQKAELAADALERTIVLHGDGLDMELLREANIERADAVLASPTTTRSTCWPRCARKRGRPWPSR
jgi:Trk K+ transport system NAD-binding subunit